MPLPVCFNNDCYCSIVTDIITLDVCSYIAPIVTHYYINNEIDIITY